MRFGKLMQREQHLGFAAPYDAHEVRPACKSGNIEHLRNLITSPSGNHPAVG